MFISTARSVVTTHKTHKADMETEIDRDIERERGRERGRVKVKTDSQTDRLITNAQKHADKLCA